MKILVIIPAFNEAGNILNTLDDLRTNCPQADVLVVNDCSTDQTLSILKREKINYLDLVTNLGIGGAVQSGYLYARDHDYDIAVQFDGDGQHMAMYLNNMIDVLVKGDADVVIGSRFMKKKGYQSSGARRTGIGLLSNLIKMLTGIRVLDVTSGMRAVNRKYIDYYADHYAQDYPEPEAILHAGLKNAKIIEVPVKMRERENGESSIDFLRSVYYMIKVSFALILDRLLFKQEKGEELQ